MRYKVQLGLIYSHADLSNVCIHQRVTRFPSFKNCNTHLKKRRGGARGFPFRSPPPPWCWTVWSGSPLACHIRETGEDIKRRELLTLRFSVTVAPRVHGIASSLSGNSYLLRDQAGELRCSCAVLVDFWTNKCHWIPGYDICELCADHVTWLQHIDALVAAEDDAPHRHHVRRDAIWRPCAIRNSSHGKKM
jgi:hypothetical protein